jgi:hypothetical protein
MDGFIGVYYFPLWVYAIVWWRCKYGAWPHMVNPIAYGNKAQHSLLAGFICWAVWIVVIWVPAMLWRAYGSPG